MAIDETDMGAEKRWRYEHLAEKAVANFKRRRIKAEYVATRGEALEKVMALIPDGATVGWGDSVTMEQIGAVEEIRRTMADRLFDPFAVGPDGTLAAKGEARIEVMRKAMAADVFLSGVNAVTEDGRMVSTDATGNRVAPTVFGPKRVIIVFGANKIVKNLDEALKRIREVVAPINAYRHVLKHNNQRFADLACARTGACVDCFHEERICRYTVIIEGEREPATVTGYVPRIHVIIVGEELGI
ncbi:MAG: lactate utilization protein [Chloroflexota bacterium]